MNDSLMDRDLTRDLASYASDLRLSHVPGAVRQQAHLCILDTIGCVVAGARVEDWHPLLEVEAQQSSREEATVIGQGRRLSADSAARVNAYMGDVFELNDLIGGHASIGNVCALLALGESLGVSGAQLVEAVIVGIEVTARVYSGYYPAMKPYDEVGMNPVTFPSSFGVAAGAARLLGLNEAQLGHAMSIAGTLASWCPAEVVFGDGGSVKPMLFGACPATSGLMAARYARAGMTGPQRLLEGQRGYFVTAARRMFPEAVRDRETWYLAAPRRKYHAACGYVHSPVDVVAALRREGASFERASEIRVGMAALTIPGVSKSKPPTSGNEARFHLEYCVALVALGADAIVPEHSLDFGAFLANPEVRSLMSKVTVVADADQKHYHHCAVTLLDSQGRELVRREGRGPKGSPQNPMTDDEVIAKFRRLVAHRLPGTASDNYVQQVQRLDAHDDWAWLVRDFDRVAEAA